MPSTQSKRVTYVSTEESFKEDLKILEGHNSTRVLGDQQSPAMESVNQER